MCNTTTYQPLIGAWLDAWNAHDIDRALQFYAPDYEGIDVAAAAPCYGVAGARATLERYLGAFPGLHITTESAVVDGDQVALVWTARGRHQGPLLNIPATGRDVVVRGMTLLTVRDHKLRRTVAVWDVAGMLRGIGLLPDLS